MTGIDEDITNVALQKEKHRDRYDRRPRNGAFAKLPIQIRHGENAYHSTRYGRLSKKAKIEQGYAFATKLAKLWKTFSYFHRHTRTYVVPTCACTVGGKRIEKGTMTSKLDVDKTTWITCDVFRSFARRSHAHAKRSTNLLGEVDVGGKRGSIWLMGV